MIGLAALILSTAYLIETAEVPLLISFTVVELGENVTLQCPDSGKVFWHKQSLGYMVQTISAVIQGTITINKPFNDSGFTVTKRDAQYFLTIRNVSKADEATYFCQNRGTYLNTFSNGTFLAVNDHKQKKSVHMKQSPETASVQPGGSVTLQCSLLSKNKENRVHCPGEHSVYWFRAGSGESHPNIIYTHRNSSDEEEERSCVYSLSKTIQDSSDTGTYYCAVVTCGEILFGAGTKVETRPELDPVVLVLGGLLACCVTVIIVLIFYVNEREVSGHYKGAMSVSHHIGHDKSTADQSNDLDGESKAVSYAAQDLSWRKVKRGKTKKEYMTECVYYVVRADYNNQ